MKNDELMMLFITCMFVIGAAVSGYITIYWCINSGVAYYYLLLIVPAAFVYLAYREYMKMHFLRLCKEVKEAWGKPDDKKRDMKKIGNLYELSKAYEKDKFLLDDQTWEDLNMDQIFAVVDRCLTTPGQQTLYKMLREPSMDSSLLKRRKEIIGLLQKDERARERVEMELVKVRFQRYGDTASFLWGEMPGQSSLRLLFFLMYIASICSIVSVPLMGAKAFLYFILPVFGINFYITSKVRGSIFSEISSMRYLGTIIKAAGGMGRMEDILPDSSPALKRDYEACRKILKRIGAIRPDSTDPFYEYFDVFFLTSVRGFYAVLDDVKKQKDSIRDIYLKIGELDAIYSVASYRSGLSSYAEPELYNGNAGVEAVDIVHPLLKEPVANSICLGDEGVIITGSNMSGKSTFLRTLGVNAVFAQTICTCLASSYRGSYFRVMTSISRSDNLVGGKSYYLAEAEALLRIIRSSGEGVPILCIIDEILRGTNSVERISASAEIMRYLVSHNSLVLVATHDIELLDLVGNLYRCYYFSERVGENGLNFDYKIKEGITNARNATKLMDYLGYPKDIVDGTFARVEDMLHSKVLKEKA